MNDTALKATLLEILDEVAPDAPLDGLDPRADLRDALDLDSMDFLNVTIAIHERLGVEIREQDYDQVRSLEGLMDYVQRAGPRPAAP